jgi:hypothetical protein
MNEAVAFGIAVLQTGDADGPYAWIALLATTALAGVGAFRYFRTHHHSDRDFIPHHVVRDPMVRRTAQRR